MRFDPPICYRILIAVESDDKAGTGQGVTIALEDIEADVVGEHIVYLVDRDMLKAIDVTHMQSPYPEFIVTDMTPEGRAYLDERAGRGREEKVWLLKSGMKVKPEDVAQVCQKGHLIVGSVKRHADFQAPFCEQCGSSTITSCQSCNWPIRGVSPTAWMADSGPYRPPSFCGECGTAFPWTKTALDAANSLIDEQDTLTKQEKAELKASIKNVTSNTAVAPVAAGKFKTLLKKMAPQAGEMLKSVVLTIVTGEAKRWIGLP